jgi:hypothetical protein
MTFIKNLKLVAITTPKSDPIIRRREALVSRLRDQIERISNPHHARLRHSWIKINGERKSRDRHIPVRPWWRQQRDGSVVFTLTVGMKRIELETGKAGIVIPNANELPKLIEGLIAAVGRGELDSQLQAVSMGRLGKG